MTRFKITQIIDKTISIRQFDDDAIVQCISYDACVKELGDSEVRIVFICLENPRDNKDDSWEKNGITYHSILLPHDEVLHASVEEVTRLCARLTVERLVAWEETQRKKAERKMRRMARAAAAE